MTETSTVDPTLSAGVRSKVGVVDVHAGIVCIAVEGGFPTGEDDSWLPRSSGAGWTGPGWVCATSGIGDGDYDVLDLCVDGYRVGVEVVFLSATVAAREQELLAALAADRPSEADYAASRAANPDPAVTDRIAAYRYARAAATSQAHDELSLAADPVAESSPIPVGTLIVADGSPLCVGDPCYDEPCVAVAVVPGSYLVIAWQSVLGAWGTRTTRLGAYRVPN